MTGIPFFEHANIRKIVLLLALQCVTVLLWGQQPAFRQLTAEDGLPGQVVYQTLQDRAGLIWMATENGLFRYDGYQYRIWTSENGLPENDVIHLMEDDRGRIWVATVGGVVFLEGDLVYGEKEAPWIPRISGLVLTLMQLDKGKICLATREGLLQFDESGTDTLAWYSEQNLRPLVIDRDSLPPVQVLPGQELKQVLNAVSGGGLPRCQAALLMAVPGGGIREARLARWRADSARLDFAFAQMQKRCGGCEVTKLYDAGDGTLWGTTNGAGVFVYQEARDETLQLLDGSSILGILTDRGGNKWISTLGEGVFILPRGHLGILNYSAENGLLESQVTSLAAGEDGTVYLGYREGQVGVKVPGKEFLHHIREDQQDQRKHIREMQELGTGELLCVSDQGGFFISEPRETGNAVREGEHLVLRKPYPFVFRQGAVKGVAVAHDSMFDLASSSGVWRCARQTGKLACRQLHRERAYTIAVEPGTENVWVATLDSLLRCPEGEACQPVPGMENLQNRVSEVQVTRLGEVWVATLGDGLYRLRGSTLQHWTKADGLPSNVCTAVDVPAPGKVWIGTDQGLGLLEGREKTWEMQSFTTRQGLAGNQVTDVVQAGNQVWVATPQGVSVFDADFRHANLPRPQLAFARVRIRGRDTLVQGRYVLSEWQNSLQLTLRDSLFQAVRYQFRMDGPEAPWEDLAAPELDFPYLEAGRSYTIEARAANREGAWSAIQRLDLLIRLPLYKRPWFGILAGLTLCALLVFLWRVRRRNQDRARRQTVRYKRQLAQSRLMALKSQMNPHFLFNSLSSIQHLVLENNPRAATQYVAKFARLMRKVLENSNAEFISLAEEIRLCRLYIELEALRLMHNFDFTIEVDPSLVPEDLRIPGMMLQPFIENAIWHGLLPKTDDRVLRFAIKAMGEELVFTIEDNGVGRQPKSSSTHQSRAVSNFEERLALFNRIFGQESFGLKYHDLKDANGRATGTRVVIRCPILEHSHQEKEAFA